MTQSNPAGSCVATAAGYKAAWEFGDWAAGDFTGIGEIDGTLAAARTPLKSASTLLQQAR